MEAVLKVTQIQSFVEGRMIKKSTDEKTWVYTKLSRTFRDYFHQYER